MNNVNCRSAEKNYLKPKCKHGINVIGVNNVE